MNGSVVPFMVAPTDRKSSHYTEVLATICPTHYLNEKFIRPRPFSYILFDMLFSLSVREDLHNLFDWNALGSELIQLNRLGFFIRLIEMIDFIRVHSQITHA